MGQLIPMQVHNPYGAIGTGEIDEFEAKNDLYLPADYRDFLLHSNGGRPMKNVHPGVQTDVHWIFGLNSAPEWASLQAQMDLYANRLPAHVLPFAGDSAGNLFVMHLDAETPGAISFWSHETDSQELEPVAPTLSEFLQQLVSDQD